MIGKSQMIFQIFHLLNISQEFSQSVTKKEKTMGQSEKPKIVFILGGPGSGKGTQCADMVQKYGFNHYSTGDLLREFIKTDSQEAIKIKQLMSQGKLVSSKMLVEIVRRSIFKDGNNGQTYLIDGFPRSAQNYEAWMDVMGDSVEIKTLLYLNCTLETLEKRLLERGKNSGRADDNIETIRKRFNTYTEQTTPFLKYYEQKVGQVHTINGEAPVQQVSGKIKNILTEEELI